MNYLLKRAAYVDRFKDMGTQPFGIENTKTDKIMGYLSDLDAQIESNNTFERKFGVSDWNEKLASFKDRLESPKKAKDYLERKRKMGIGNVSPEAKRKLRAFAFMPSRVREGHSKKHKKKPVRSLFRKRKK